MGPPSAAGSVRPVNINVVSPTLKLDSNTELHTKSGNILSSNEQDPASPISYEKERGNTGNKPASSIASSSVRPEHINIVSPKGENILTKKTNKTCEPNN